VGPNRVPSPDAIDAARTWPLEADRRHRLRLPASLAAFTEAVNKILWAARRANGTALWIRARRMAGSDRVGAPVSRVIAGGPGPSIVNLPAPGCWRLTLRWAGETDTLDLEYVANRRP
jgi:hypothetical protein